MKDKMGVDDRPEFDTDVGIADNAVAQPTPETQPADSALDDSSAQPVAQPASQPVAQPVAEAMDQPEAPEEVAHQPQPEEPAKQMPQPSLGMPASQAISLITNPTAQQLDQQHIAQAQDLASGAIHPQTYADMFEKKSTLGKIGTIFGLLVGGAGAGLSHQPNALLGMMQKEIDNEFQAQLASKTGANNFLNTSYNHELQQTQQKLTNAQAALIPLTAKEVAANTQNIQADAQLKATNNAKASIVLGIMNNLEGTIAKAPPAQQPAMQSIYDGQVKPMLIQTIQQGNAQTAGQLGARAALRGQQEQQQSPQQNPQASMDPDQVNADFKKRQDAMRMSAEPGLLNVADAELARFVPNVGSATVPVDPQARMKLAAAKLFDDRLQKYINFVGNLSNEDRLNPKFTGQAAVMQQELGSAYNQAIGGGVFDPSQKKAMDDIVPSATKVLPSFTVLPKLKALAQDNQMRTAALLNQYGFPSSTMGSFNQAKTEPKKPGSGPKEGATGTYKGQPVVYKGGNWVLAPQAGPQTSTPPMALTRGP